MRFRLANIHHFISLLHGVTAPFRAPNGAVAPPLRPRRAALAALSCRPLGGPVAAPYCGPVAALSAAPSPPFQQPCRRPSTAPWPPFHGLVARPYSGPVAALTAAPLPPFRGPDTALLRPRRRPFSGPIAALSTAPSPPALSAAPRRPFSGPSPLFQRPVAALSAARGSPSSGPVAALPQPRRCSTAQRPSRRAAQPPSSRAAEQPNRRVAEPPDRRAALQPSRPTAEPPSIRAAEQPSRPSTEPPWSRAALPPCRPAAEPPSRTAAEALPPVGLPGTAPLAWADGLSLFDLTSCASPASAADADATVCSQWATRDAAARLALRRHLPTTEHAHLSQYKSAQTLYDVVVARYSSPATTALSRLMLPYLFSDLAAFPTVADLITHLRTSDTRYRVALPAEFCTKNIPPIYITLYYIVTRLPDSLRVVRDHFLSVCPTTLNADLLEKALLAAEKSIVAVGASRGDPRTPVFEGQSALRLPRAEDAAPARARGARALEGLEGAVEVVVEAVEGVGVVVGVVPGVAAAAAAVEAAEAVVVAEGAEAAEGAKAAEVAEEVEVEDAAEAALAAAVVERVATLRKGVAQEWWSAPAAAEWCDPVPSAAFVQGDYYLCVPPEPGIEATAVDTGGAPALGASASAAPDASASAAPGASASVAPGAGESSLSDRTTLTPLSRPVAVSLADPSGGPVLASFSTVLPCPAAPSGTLSGLYLPSFSMNLVIGADLQDRGVDQFTPASQRVTHCTCARTGRHLATFTRRPGSSLYTLTTESPPAAESAQVAASSQVFAAASRSGPESAPCSCRLLSHQTLLWHHRLGHPSLTRLRGMASRILVSGLPRSLPPLPLGPGPTCVPCVEGRQRAAPHSSEFPPTEATLQTLHMDVWGPARVCGQGHERYFLLVVDDYSRYTTVFPLRSKDDVTEVLIDWIRAARLQL
ncbi:unnamed protein product [Closterium sp. NIES-64]|nr:unnamed protein product [Closterium sp. NIES-64]